MEIRTIYEVTSVVMFCVIGYMLLIHLSTPGLRGLRWVIAGYSCAASAMLLIASRGHIPSFLSISIATLLLSSWNIFLYLGVADLLGARKRISSILLLSLLPLLIFTNYFVYLDERLAARIMVYSLVSMVQYLLLGFFILRNGSPRTRMPRIGMAVLFLLWSIAHLLRGIYAFHERPATMLDESTRPNSVIVVIPVIIAIMTCLGFIWLAMAQLQSELEQQSHTDSLTGLLNRRALQTLAEREIARAGRQKLPLSLVICDLDHFKTVNDRFGHNGGDDALIAAANCIVDGLRTGDVVARLGGEEFVMLLPGTEETVALQVAERLRVDIADLQVQHRSRIIKLSASFGIASLQKTDKNLDDLLHRADRALYRAKAEGRNRTVIFHQAVDTSSSSGSHLRAIDRLQQTGIEPESQAG